MISELIGMTLTDRAWLQTLISLSVLVVIAVIGNWIAKRIVLNVIGRALAHTPIGPEAAAVMQIARRMSNIVPALIVANGVRAVPHLPAGAVTVVGNVASAFMILTIGMALAAMLDLGAHVYNRRPHTANRPVRGYVQVGKIVIYCTAALLMIAALVDRSPVLLLSGLGALAAVLMLVFQDTILGLVASVQLTSNDMVRVGDWIEMPKYDADGDVIDIALHTVKIRNFDRTITTIPTRKLIEDSFKNWRGMQDAGGRRIKRSLMIDQNSVRFLSDAERARLHGFALIDPYLSEKEDEIAAWNGAAPERATAVNARRITNIGTFRAYVQAYLRAHAGIHSEMLLLVRQLAPGPQGLPIEIYCFAGTTAWIDYENIQSDIFDHLIAILPEFGLKLFQEPTGMDLGQAMRRETAAAAA